MRLVVQRVNGANVKVGGKIVGEIGKGLSVLVGVAKEDSKKDAEALAEKLSKLRVMADKKGKMNLSIKDLGAKVLVVSQFTLYGDTSGGNRPSFIHAAEPSHAQEIYEHFISQLTNRGIEVETGSFGAYMRIETILDGPVTILFT